jgi:hypothetical protein
MGGEAKPPGGSGERGGRGEEPFRRERPVRRDENRPVRGPTPPTNTPQMVDPPAPPRRKLEAMEVPGPGMTTRETSSSID